MRSRHVLRAGAMATALLSTTAALALSPPPLEPEVDVAAMLQQVEASRQTWNELNEAVDSDYSYTAYWSSWTGYAGQTTLVFDNGVAIERRYEASRFGEVTDSWSEEEDDVGNNEAGAPVHTLEALYDACETRLSSLDNPADYWITLRFDTKGLLNTCTTAPRMCMDDCSSGVQIRNIELHPDARNIVAGKMRIQCEVQEGCFPVVYTPNKGVVRLVGEAHNLGHDLDRKSYDVLVSGNPSFHNSSLLVESMRVFGSESLPMIAADGIRNRMPGLGGGNTGRDYVLLPADSISGHPAVFSIGGEVYDASNEVVRGLTFDADLVSGVLITTHGDAYRVIIDVQTVY